MSLTTAKDNPLDILLLVFGFDMISIKKPSLIKKIICSIPKILILSIMIYTKIVMMEICSNSHVPNLVHRWLLPVSLLIKTIFIMISFITFQIKFTNIKHLNSTLRNVLNNRERSKNKVAQWVSLLLWITFISGETIGLIATKSKPYVWNFQHLAEIEWTILVFGWHIAMMLFLINICFVIHLYEKRILQHGHITVETVEGVIMRIRRLFDSVNDNLGFLPFY